MSRIVILAFTLSFFQCKPIEKDAGDTTIRSLMTEQMGCWNDGDIDCFMQSYWNSDSLMFIGNSGLTYGWENTRSNYKTAYPTKEKMGLLKFEILEIITISPKAKFVVGKWHLSREIGDLKGHFSLLWKKIDHQWLIVNDHSS